MTNTPYPIKPSKPSVTWPVVLSMAIVLSCGKGLPNKPTPIPSPSIEPSAAPDSFPGRLRVEGSDFVSPKGIVRLFGGVVCCEGYPANGWPWASESSIHTFANAGGNFLHFRLGPFTAQGERPEFVAYKDAGNGKVDLDQWDDGFWQRLSQRLADARSHGAYVELDLIDAWVLERPELSPWYKENNVNGVNEGDCDGISQPPSELQKKWLAKIVSVTAPFDNVIYQVSNESGGGNCYGLLKDEWEIGVIEYVKSLHSQALVGTNSGRSNIEAVADYVEIHGWYAPTVKAGKPTMVNEYSEDLTPEDYAKELNRAKTLGTSFHYWRGAHDADAFARSMAFLKQFTGSGN